MLAADNTGDVAVTRAKALRRRIGALISVGIQTRALRWGTNCRETYAARVLAALRAACERPRVPLVRTAFMAARLRAAAPRVRAVFRA